MNSTKKKLLVVRINVTLRGLDGRGHFKTVSISFRRRSLYGKKGKYQNLNGGIYGFGLKSSYISSSGDKTQK